MKSAKKKKKIYTSDLFKYCKTNNNTPLPPFITVPSHLPPLIMRPTPSPLLSSFYSSPPTSHHLPPQYRVSVPSLTADT